MLHNLVIDQNDLWSEEDDPVILNDEDIELLHDEDVELMDENFPVQGLQGSGNMMLSQVMDHMLYFCNRPRGFLTWEL